MTRRVEPTASVDGLRAWSDRLGRTLALPGDTEDDRAEKALVALIECAAIPALILFGVLLFLSGRHLAGLLATVDSLVQLGVLLVFLRLRCYHLARTLFMVLNLVGPFALQWAAGGIWASGIAMLWALSGPIAAATLRVRARHWWFVGYVGLVVVSVLLDGDWVHHTGSPAWLRFLFLWNVLGASTFIYLALGYFTSELRAAKAAVQRERERSDALLLNILPSSVADRLKGGEEVIADRADDVSVLFADIVGFTPISLNLSPEAVVEMLNTLFSAFDDLADRHGLEKIKTIGDAYMAVAGAPLPRNDHATAAVEMAIDMLAVMDRFRTGRGTPLDIRIGINSGPVLTAVIGKRKFAYDVYGATVNTASRMESHGVPGAVHVSPETYRLLRDAYDFTELPPMEVKGTGWMTTYLLVGRKPVEPAAPAVASLPHSLDTIATD